MKPIHIISTLAIAGGLAFSGCDKKSDATTSSSDKSGKNAPAAPLNEKDAIAKFKTDVEAVVKWQAESEKAAPPNDPVAGMAKVTEMIGKFKGVSTNGLPADLSKAWGDFNGVLGELGGVVGKMPKVDPADAEAGMKAMMEILPKMMELQAKVEPIVKTLQEVGKKYGIDDLEKVGPGGGGGGGGAEISTDPAPAAPAPVAPPAPAAPAAPAPVAPPAQ